MSGEPERARIYAKLDRDSHAKAVDVEGRLELAVKRLGARQLAIGELRGELEGARTPGVPEDPTPSCVRRRPFTQEALGKMAVEYEKLVDETLYLWRDATNEELTRLRFIQPPAAYRISFAAQVSAYLGFVNTLNAQLPLIKDPCAGQDTSPRAKFELAAPGAGPCPFSMDFHAVVATLHIDCHTFGFDFQAGLAFSATKDFTSGETASCAPHRPAHQAPPAAHQAKFAQKISCGCLTRHYCLSPTSIISDLRPPTSDLRPLTSDLRPLIRRAAASGTQADFLPAAAAAGSVCWRPSAAPAARPRSAR